MPDREHESRRSPNPRRRSDLVALIPVVALLLAGTFAKVDGASRARTRQSARIADLHAPGTTPMSLSAGPERPSVSYSKWSAQGYPAPHS